MANTLKFKRGLLAGLPTAAEGEPLFTTDSKDLYIGTSTGNQRFQKYIASGATTQILRGDGSLYSFPLAISSPSNGQVLKFNGTSWVNDSDAGITGSGSAGQVAYFTGATTQAGSNNLFWDNTNGRLGINTNVPSNSLHVVGTALISGATNIGGVLTTGAIVSSAVGGVGGQEGLRIYNNNAYISFFNTANTTRSAYVQGNTTDLTLATSLSTPIIFITNATEKMRLDASGNLLVGNPTGAACKLLVKGAGAADDISLEMSGNTVKIASLGHTGGHGSFILRTNGGIISTYLRTDTGLSYINVGNLHIGGTSDNGQKLQVTGTGYFSDTLRIDGNVGIGGSASTARLLNISKNITGASTSYGSIIFGNVQSDVTGGARIYYTEIGTAAAAFTLPELHHYYAVQGTFGAGSAVTSQFGFHAHSGMIGATNNFGFYGNIPSGTGRWNLYMNGSANNYIAGSIGIGSTTLTGYNLRINKDLTGATSSFGVSVGGQILSDVTSTAALYQTNANTQNATFTLTNINHFRASQGTFGASSTVTNQHGFWVDASLVGATNNFGFYGNIPSGTNRWNLYMNGSANNHLNGSLAVGTTTFNDNLNPYKSVVFYTTTGSGGGGFMATSNQAANGANAMVSSVQWGLNDGSVSKPSGLFFNYSNVTHGNRANNTVGNFISRTLVAANNLSITNNNGYISHIDLNSTSNDYVNYQAYLYVQRNSGTVNVNSYQGFRSMYQTAVGSETITNIFDFVAAQPTLSTSALVTNRYGLFIDFNNTQVTNAWGIYQSSNTVKNYINGNLLLGSTTDTTEKLQVTGAAKITGTATVGSITLPADGIITSGTTWNTGVLRFFNGPTEYASFDVPNGRFKFNQPNILFEAGVLSYTGTIDNFAYGLKTNNVERVRIKTEGHVRFIPLSAAPTTNVQSGDVYYDSTTNKLRCYNGTSWNDLF